MANAGGTVLCHLDPGAHDEQTVNSFRTLFDVYDGADGWNVRTRA